MRRSLPVVVTAVLFLACARDPFAAKRHAIAAAHAAQAEAALAQRDYPRALLAASAAAEADPLDPSMHDLLLRARLTALARSPESTQIANAAELDYAAEMLVQRDPLHKTDYLLARGELALASGKDEVAGRFFKEALAAPDAGAAAPLAMGRLEEREGKRDDALKSFEAALKAEPENTQALTALGGEELVADKAADAAKHLALAVKHQDATAVSHRLYGLALFQQKDVAKAGEELQKAVHEDPKDGLSAHALGDFWLATGQLDRAQQAYQVASKLGAEPEATYGLAEVAARRNDNAHAAPLFAAVAQAKGGTLESAFEAGVAYARAGQHDEAQKWLGAYVRAASTVPAEQQRVAQARSFLGQLGGAQPAMAPPPPPPSMPPTPTPHP